MASPYITNPMHGGKISCHKCTGFFMEGKDVPMTPITDRPDIFFHEGCYAYYEHYYGLDKPID